MSLTSQIHIAHRNGLTKSICQALALTEESQGQKLLRILVEPGVTYAELVALKERAIVRAVDRFRGEEKLDISESRVDYLLDLFPLVSPDRRVCSDCGAWDLSLKAGTWSVVAQGHCIQCDNGVYQLVGFTKGPVSWVNGKTYDLGVERDENRCPLTDAAIRETLSFRGQVVDPLILSTLGEVDPSGTMDLTHLCGYLHTEGEKLSPENVLGSLTSYPRFATDPIALKVFLGKVFDRMGFSRVYDDQSGGQKVIPTGSQKSAQVVRATPKSPKDPVDPRVFRSRFRRLLADAFPTAREASDLCSSLIGFTKSRVDWSGSPESMWSSILQEVENCHQVKELLTFAGQGKPMVFDPLWDCYLDLPTLREKLHSVTDTVKRDLAQRFTGYSWSGDNWELFDRISRHGSLVELARVLDSVG